MRCGSEGLHTQGRKQESDRPSEDSSRLIEGGEGEGEWRQEGEVISRPTDGWLLVHRVRKIFEYKSTRMANPPFPDRLR